jgi:hypothetical protein
MFPVVNRKSKIVLPLGFFGQLIDGIAEGTIYHRCAIDQFDIVGSERSTAGFAFDFGDPGLAGQVHLVGYILGGFLFGFANGQDDQYYPADQRNGADAHAGASDPSYALCAARSAQENKASHANAGGGEENKYDSTNIQPGNGFHASLL